MVYRKTPHKPKTKVVQTSPICILKKGTHEGYEWCVTHNGIDHCGYVKIEPGHPWFKKDFWDIDCTVQGGLSYSLNYHPGESTLSKNSWWVGLFLGDFVDPNLMSEEMKKIYSKYLGVPSHWNIRNQEYAEYQCCILCVQAKKAMQDKK